MLLNKHNPIVSKEFNNNDKEILAYILYKPKKFKEFISEDKKGLLIYLIKLHKFLGIKEIPPNEQLKILVNLIVDEYPTFNAYELDKAVKMAVMGKLDVDNNHYQALTPMYISNIIIAYKNKRNLVYKKYRQIQDRLDSNKPSKNISKKEKLDICINLAEIEYKDYLADTENYKVSDFRNSQFKYIYLFLVEHHIIKEYKYKDDEKLKKYIVNWFAYLYDKRTTPKLHIYKKLNIEHKK